MTAKQFTIIREVPQIYKDLTLYEVSDGIHTFLIYENAQELTDLLNELSEDNEMLRKAIDTCQFRTLDLLDYIKEKETVTHQEIKDWWNSEVME